MDRWTNCIIPSWWIISKSQEQYVKKYGNCKKKKSHSKWPTDIQKLGVDYDKERVYDRASSLPIRIRHCWQGHLCRCYFRRYKLCLAAHRRQVSGRSEASRRVSLHMPPKGPQNMAGITTLHCCCSQPWLSIHLHFNELILSPMQCMLLRASQSLEQLMVEGLILETNGKITLLILGFEPITF